MEFKQITDSIKTAQDAPQGRTRFLAFLKMPHMKKSRIFGSFESEQEVIEWAKGCEADELKRKADQKGALAQKRQAQGELDRLAAQNCQPGQIFVETWGYDQTNVDFYQVVSVKGVTATLRELNQQTKETLSMQGVAVPVKDSFKGGHFQKRVVDYGGGRPSFCGRAHGWMTLWGGQPVSWSSYA
jgi:hypothetical protein